MKMEKILMIDDDEQNLLLFSETLKQFLPDCVALTASSGSKGIEKARTELPGTILLDIHMPEMDGFEVCRILKSDQTTKYIPIIFITGDQTNAQNRIRGLEAGGDVFLAKPVGSAELISQVRAMLRIRRTEDILRREKKLLESIVREKTTALVWESSVNEALAELSSALISPLSIETISFLVLEKAKKLTGSRYGFTGYIDPITGYLVCPALIRDTGEKENVFEEFRDYWRHVPKNRNALAFNTPEDASHISETLPGRVPIHRFLSVLAQIGMETVGQIILVNSDWDYTEQDLRLAERLAALYAVAVQRNRAEEELISARKRAESASRAKTEFLSNMGHEIRTPMNAVMGMLDMVLDTGLDHRQREYLSLARHSAGSLLYMLNGLLDLSRIEAGKTDINHRNFNLASLMKSAVVPVRLEAEKKGLKMEYAVSGDIPDILTGDPELLRRVFLNLVRNAVKFTEKGRVSVQVRKTGSRTDQQVRLVFSVADTGIGIPADKLDTIFETFSQADGSIRRKYGGTGLGLTIAKKLVEHMGGDIRVKSEVGQGSTFCFELSFDPQNAETRADAADDLSDHAMLSPSPPPALPRDRIRILLAEDDRVNQKVISCILENAGYEVMIVPDGKAVLEILEHVRFSLILMDVRMPEMDGLETTRRIRNPTGVIESGGIPRFRTDLPIIALTANVLTKDREMCFEAGMNDYLPKPADRQTLVEKTEKFVPSVPGTKNGKTFSLPLFWEKGFSCFQSLKADFSRGEQEKTESHAHEIKKMASDAGAYKIADEVFRFELALRKGHMEKAGAMFERMENAFHALKALLENQNWKSARSEIKLPNMNTTTPENGN